MMGTISILLGPIKTIELRIGAQHVTITMIASECARSQIHSGILSEQNMIAEATLLLFKINREQRLDSNMIQEANKH